jgi:hypothetical protein
MGNYTGHILKRKSGQMRREITNLQAASSTSDAFLAEPQAKPTSAGNPGGSPVESALVVVLGAFTGAASTGAWFATVACR